jgi:branched-chain amino acid transport system substrate-binding protein
VYHKIKRQLKPSICLYILMAITLILVGCGPQATPAPTTPGAAPVQNVKIIIGDLPNFTGAYAEQQAGYAQCYPDAIKWVNDNKYIPGVELEWKWVDAGTDVAKATAGFKKLVAETPKPVIILSHSSPIGVALKSLMVEEKVPSQEGGSAGDIFLPPAWTFGYAAPYAGQVGAYIDWIKSVWKEQRAPRLAFFNWDVPSLKAMDNAESRAYAKAKGVEIVGHEALPTAPTTTEPQLLRLREAKADFTFGLFYASTCAMVLKDAQRLGIKVGLGKDICITDIGVTPSDLVKYAPGSLTEGLMIWGGWPLPNEWPTKAPRIDQMYKGNNRTTPPMDYIIGLCPMTGAIEAVKIAAAKVGPAKVDGQAVYDATCTMTNFDMWMSSSVTWNKNKTWGGMASALYEMKNGEAVRLNYQALTLDLLPGGKDVPK